MDISEHIGLYGRFNAKDLRTLVALTVRLTELKDILGVYTRIETDLSGLKRRDGNPRFAEPVVLEHLLQGELYGQALPDENNFISYHDRERLIQLEGTLFEAIESEISHFADGRTYFPFRGKHSEAYGRRLEGRLLGVLSVKGELEKSDSRLLKAYADAVSTELTHRYLNKSRQKEKERALKGVIRTTKAVVHDVNNRLNVLTIGLGLLQVILGRGEQENGEGGGMVIRRMGDAIKGIDEELTYTLKSAEGDYISRYPTDLISLIEEAVEIRRQMSAGVTLEYQSGPKYCTIIADALALRMAIGDLITNAIKNSGTGDAVTVRVEKTEGSVNLKISNPGHIPEQLLPHIFTEGVTNGRGTGFGLAYARETVDNHRGTIELRNEGDLVICDVKIPLT